MVVKSFTIIPSSELKEPHKQPNVDLYTGRIFLKEDESWWIVLNRNLMGDIILRHQYHQPIKYNFR
jgi:hypothetical protein